MESTSEEGRPAWLRIAEGGREPGMLAAYSYELYGFTERRELPFPSGQPFEEALRQHGFGPEPDFYLGDLTREIAAEVFSRTRFGRSEYLVFIHLPGDRADTPEGIYVSTRPALVRLLAELAPVLRVSMVSADRAERSAAA